MENPEGISLPWAVEPFDPEITNSGDYAHLATPQLVSGWGVGKTEPENKET